MYSIESTISEIGPTGFPALETAVRARWDSLTKPRGSLGRLEDSVLRLALIKQRPHPPVERQGIYIFCGDHGVTEEGVSAYPSAVTGEMMKNFIAGGAAINVLCRSFGISTYVIDAGVAGPKLPGVMDCRIADGTQNLAHGPAMTHAQLTTAINRGIALGRQASSTYDLVGVGDMGIGNTTSASALLCAFTGIEPEAAVGRGAGLDDQGLLQKRDVITRALAFHQAELISPMAIASVFAGFEIAVMAGFLLGAASCRLPVMLDGFVTGAAFLLAQSLCSRVSEYVLFSHCSAEPGHQLLLQFAQAKPLLALDMRLGEGTGAALAMNLLTQAVKLYEQMATFGEAAVSDKR